MGVHKKIMYGTPIANANVPSVVNDAENKQIIGVGLTKGLYDSQSQVKTDYSKIVDAVGIRSDVIVAGNSILGVEGTASSGVGGMDTSDGNITAEDVIDGKIGYNSAGKVVGNMVDRRGVSLDVPPSALSVIPNIKMVSWKPLSTFVIGNTTTVRFAYSILSKLLNITENKIKKGENILGVSGTVVPFETRTVQLPNADAVLDSTSGQINCDKLELRLTDENKFYIYAKTTKTATIIMNPVIIEQPRLILRRFQYYENSFDLGLEITKPTLLVFNFASANVIINVYIEGYVDESRVKKFKATMFSDNIELEGIFLDYEVIQ